MAEFCLDCLNKFGESRYKWYQVVKSPVPCFCEGCEQYKPVVIGFSSDSLLRYLKKVGISSLLIAAGWLVFDIASYVLWVHQLNQEAEQSEW